MVWQILAFTIAVGVMAAPDLLGLESAVADAFHILGPIAASVAAMAMSTILRGVRRAHLLLGPAIAAAGLLLGGGTAALVVGIVAGGALTVLAFPGDVPRDMYDGGWRMLVRGSHER